MFRRYNRWWSRFDQPDPYDGSYDLADPQSLNRYSYTQNDPVNFTDPTGLDPGLGGLYAVFGSHVADLPGFGTNWGSFFRERERAEYPQAHRRFDAILQNAQALP